jgi:hypothetical protein
MASSQQDLSQFTKRQLADLAWQLKGTPAVQPIYQEISRRPAKSFLQPDDPDWEAKFSEILTQAFREAEGN